METEGPYDMAILSNLCKYSSGIYVRPFGVTGRCQALRLEVGINFVFNIESSYWFVQTDWSEPHMVSQAWSQECLWSNAERQRQDFGKGADLCSRKMNTSSIKSARIIMHKLGLLAGWTRKYFSLQRTGGLLRYSLWTKKKQGRQNAKYGSRKGKI